MQSFLEIRAGSRWKKYSAIFYRLKGEQKDAEILDFWVE